jgi:hypothetical protein
MCPCHFKKKFSHHIIKIQACWRAYRTRCKIKNLYINLPPDLKNLVLHFMTLEFRVKSRLLKFYKNQIFTLEKTLTNYMNAYVNYQIYEWEDYLIIKMPFIKDLNYCRSRMVLLNLS